jgi:hypothetical protein
MEVSGQYHAPAALPPAENPGTHWGEGCVGLRARLDDLEERKASLPYGDSNFRPSSL